ncbi:hypothetical protein [Malonomonas rubra]|uniref:hypothetical protein n=1 Tax=Malonomonas rubra TaxID=57040 RepID=UPI0026EDE0A2|nr:hypothetical protein [Malonomonas rubra]
MDTIWVGKSVEQTCNSSLGTLMQHLLVDVIPVILLLAAMLYGMAFVSHKLEEPRIVDVRIVADKPG